MRNLKILAWVHLVSGLLTGLVGSFFIGAFEGEDAVIGVIFVSLLMLKGVSSIVLGWGLLARKPWSRLLGIVLSVLHLPLFPVGTAIGIFGLMVLPEAETRRLLAAGEPRLRTAQEGLG